MEKKRSRAGTKGGAARRNAAQALAIDALTFLAAEPQRLGRFLAITGIGPDEIRAAASHADFLAGVLDYVVGEEPLLLAFAEEAQIKPDAVMQAASALGSGIWEREVP
jgi:hypothetical protein